MTAEEAAERAVVLRARVAVPIHYRCTAGPIRDLLLLRYDGTRAVRRRCRLRGTSDTGQDP